MKAKSEWKYKNKFIIICFYDDIISLLLLWLLTLLSLLSLYQL